ncbi:somatostatin 6 [Anguilla rostrata]|uniref:somatostatin 6 n=1 Tax=Anguilla rostrata TaxID=7938 RepID=UPI0030D58068
MNLLVSYFVPLILISWGGQRAGALPTGDRLALLGNGALAQEHIDFLLKMLSGLPELSGQEEEEEHTDLDSDLQQQRRAKFRERSLVGRPVPRERSPCKNFFWKTFSSC